MDLCDRIISLQTAPVFNINFLTSKPISNETRNEMNKTLKQLPDEEQIAFRNYVENFNVEMDF